MHILKRLLSFLVDSIVILLLYIVSFMVLRFFLNLGSGFNIRDEIFYVFQNTFFLSSCASYFQSTPISDALEPVTSVIKSAVPGVAATLGLVRRFTPMEEILNFLSYCTVAFSYFYLLLVLFKKTLGMTLLKLRLTSINQVFTGTQILKREITFYLWYFILPFALTLLTTFLLGRFCSESSCLSSSNICVTCWIFRALVIAFLILSKVLYKTFFVHDHCAETSVIEE